MSIQDLHVALTRMVAVQADAAESLAAMVGGGELPASTALFVTCARLCRAADRLYRIVELELTVRLAEGERTPGDREGAAR